MIGLIALMAAIAAPMPVRADAAKSVQQLFDGAGAASDRGDATAALAGYDEIERRIGGTGKPATLATLRARRGVLLNAMGRPDEAMAPLRYAMANIDRQNPALRGDRYMLAWSVGMIEERALDYAAAARSYRQAETETETPQDRRVMWASIARVTMFDDPSGALVLVEKALAALGADAGTTKAALAEYRTLKARILLNGGDYPAARRELDLAVKDLGGLSVKLDLADVAARSDMAIAALLFGDKEAARKYLAYTGAGTQRDVLDPPTGGLEAPQCGGDTGLTPEDVAVVQFTIKDDGTVSAVAPVYVSRRGGAAMAFAKAVANWGWSPEQAAKIKPFFRTLLRVELRCSMAQQRPSIDILLAGEAEAWSAGRSGFPIHGKAQSNDEWGVSAAKAADMAEAEQAPAPVIAYFASQAASQAGGNGYSRRQTQLAAAALGVVADRPSIARDPRARSAVSLLRVDALMSIRSYPSAQPLVDAIVADPALGEHDPLKVGALLRLATIRAAAGDLAAARAAYERTGLAAQQCALIDARPALVGSNASSDQFPAEALRWGFEGWTQTEFDVTAEGRAANARTIAAYPPFVFSSAAVSVQLHSRYTQSYRPEGGLGCGGQQQRIRFGLPYKH